MNKNILIAYILCMRTRYLYIIYALLIFSVFILPVVFSKQKDMHYVENIHIDNQENNSININDKENSKIIKLLLTESNEIIELDLDEYIRNVVSAEMPAKYEIEALKAQAIVARTYALNKMNNTTHENNADVCNSIQCCQAYMPMKERLQKWNESNNNALQLWDRIDEAVVSTRNLIVVYNNEPIQAFFHANSGGKTEDASLVWNEENIAYLQSVETKGEDNYSQYSSEVIIDKKNFINILQEKYSDFQIDFNDNNCIMIIEKSNSDRVLKIMIGNIEISGIEVRKIFGLKSTNFEVNVLDNSIIFNVIGYGHGVGMSQTGANELAKNGYTYENIIYHYYSGVQIKKME